MGQLAEKYGFYGEVDLPINVDAAQGEAGEALTISDPQESWMFHNMVCNLSITSRIYQFSPCSFI